jgi:hypothetical protein
MLILLCRFEGEWLYKFLGAVSRLTKFIVATPHLLSIFIPFSNMTIRCGDTGARDNLCWIAEGDLHVDATPFRGISDATVEGVIMEGIVFIGARKYSTWATKPGDITFVDCEWRVSMMGSDRSLDFFVMF